MRSFISMVGAALVLAGCAAGNANITPFERFMIEQKVHLVDVVLLSELMQVSESYSLVHFDKYLEENGMVVRGEGDSAYVLGRELLELCGPDCAPDAGLGQVLVHFTSLDSQDRL